MKLLTMERIKGDGSEDGEGDWFVKFDTVYEEDLYDTAVSYFSKVPVGNPNEEYFNGFGHGMLKGMLSVGLGDRYSDEDIYYYFKHDDNVPDVGDTFTLDDITWRRIK